MKIKLLGLLLILIMALPAVAAPPQGKMDNFPAAAKIAQTDNTTFINANRILMFVTNHANWGRDLGGYFGNDYGTYFPYSDTSLISSGADVRSPYYAGGLWVGGIDSATGEKLVTVSIYSDEYVPGPMAGGTYQADIPAYRVYKLYLDSLWYNPNQDYLDYLANAVPNQGAPMPYVIDTTVDSTDDGEGGYVITTTIDTTSAILGDQMLWSVSNDANPDQHINDAGNRAPIGIEVKNTTFAFDRQGSLGNIVVIRLQIYNRGDRTMEDCFFSIWSDPDLGGAGDDLVACDTLLDLGYIYNFGNNDNYYGETPPCLGLDFFQGPLVESPTDTARMWGTLYPGYKNLGLYSFNKYINGTDPNDYNESYNFMKGLNKDGSPYVYDGDTLTFVCSGDPIAGIGDTDIAPADRRMMQTTGPITFRPGDSTEIYLAIIVGMGVNNINSIEVMKGLDIFAQKLYESDFNPPKAAAKPVVTVASTSGNISLSWTNLSENEPGDFPFEGYTVWQGESPAGPWVELETYDLVNGYDKALIDTLEDSYSKLYLPVVQRALSNSGLVYHYTATSDVFSGFPLRDLTEYYFRVSAFSFSYFMPDSSDVPRGDRFLESQTTVTVAPRSPAAGIHPAISFQDTIPATHSAGGSDGLVYPLVVDPLALTGHDYRVIFKDTTIDAADAVIWYLEDITTGDTVLASQTNLSGDDSYFTVDGFLLKVSGPNVGFKSFLAVANGAGVLDPPEAAAFGGAGFPVGDLDPDTNPTTRQQVGGARWAIHTADNGGTCGGGTRGGFDAFFARATRDGDNFASIGVYDYEMRFTGSYDEPEVGGSYVVNFDNPSLAHWVPFELWRTGIGTPDDPSDDVQMIGRMIDGDGGETFNLESWGCVTDPLRSGVDGEHSVSGADNDPFTDWLYWYLPTDMTPGSAGYEQNEAQMLAGTYDYEFLGDEVFARFVLVNWNGHTADGDTLTNPPVFNMDMPEEETIFRIGTFKPNTAADTFLFTAEAPTMTANQADLDKIKAVPNPFYLSGRYDPNPGSYLIKFHHLPPACTIKIYNLAGDLMRTIEKTPEATLPEETGIAGWDVLTERGLPVASGIYIYVVDAPGFGKKIGKMAVFVESEVLRIY